jgi:hypothetical protein
MNKQKTTMFIVFDISDLKKLVDNFSKPKIEIGK